MAAEEMMNDNVFGENALYADVVRRTAYGSCICLWCYVFDTADMVYVRSSSSWFQYMLYKQTKIEPLQL